MSPIDRRTRAYDGAPLNGHFRGCHPEHSKAPETPEGHEIKNTEDCWHCGTPTSRGCDCRDCMHTEDYIQPSLIYHCQTCGRWWVYMTGINLTTTTITFGA